MGTAVVIALIALFVSGLVGQGYQRWTRTRGLRSIPEVERTRHSCNVSLKVLLQGRSPRPAFRTGRTNRTRADLVLSKERFLIATDRGVLLDLPRDRASGLSLARCTGPQRLVLEGEWRSGGGKRCLYRLEMVTADAEDWVRDLAPFLPVDAPPSAFPAPQIAQAHG